MSAHWTKPAGGSGDTARDRLQRDQIRQLLDKLDSVDETRYRNRRAGVRARYRRYDVPIIIYHPGGSKSEQLVATRNLSPSGLGFIYTSFLHNGTIVEVALERRLGSVDRIAGRVVFCAHISNIFHQVGVRFDQKIFAKLYLDGPAPDREEELPAPAVSLPALVPLRPAKVLLVEMKQVDCVLLEHHLRDTPVQVMVASDERTAVKAVRSAPYDLILCDLNSDADGTRTIAALRASGFMQPICLLPGEQMPLRIEAALQAGVTAILQKPYDVHQLRAFLAAHLASPPTAPETAPPSRPLLSNLPADHCQAGQLAHYVGSVQSLAAEIRKAADSGELDRVRQMCMALGAGGATYGFPSLFEAARDALRLLETTAGIDGCRRQIDDLADLCRRVAAPE